MYLSPDSHRSGRSLGLDAELLLLRKRTGFTADRLERLPSVLRLLGSDGQSFDLVRDRFIAALQSLPPEHADLLLAIYGLAGATRGVSTLLERRAIYGQTIGRGVDTVAALEPIAIAGLRAQLVIGWYPDSSAAATVPMLHSGLVHESVSIRTAVLDGRWVETHEHYRFVAAADGIEHFTVRSPQIGRPVVAGNFMVRTTLSGDGVCHEFRHSIPMRRGHTYDLRFRVVPDAEYGEYADASQITEATRSYGEPARFVDFEVVFSGAKPALAWWFEAPERSDWRSQIDDWQGLPRRGRSVAAQFQDLAGGLHHGVAWRW